MHGSILFCQGDDTAIKGTFWYAMKPDFLVDIKHGSSVSDGPLHEQPLQTEENTSVAMAISASFHPSAAEC